MSRVLERNKEQCQMVESGLGCSRGTKCSGDGGRLATMSKQGQRPPKGWTNNSILSPYRASSYAKEGCLCVGPSTVSNMLQSFPSSSNTSDCPPRWSKRQPSSSRRHSIRNHSFFSRRSRHNSSHHLARQISDSRIHSLNAQNGSPIQVFDGRHSFKWSTSTGDSAVGSHGGASDWWSMQTFSDLVASSRRERLRWIDATSPSDFGWVLGRESMDRVSLAEERIRDINCQAPSMSSHVDVQTCGICSKLLSQRSPSSSETMMAANDLSVVAVLVCGHVYHAECLEQITSEASRQDPACPICVAREKMPSKRLTSPVEQLNKTKGGSLMAYRSQSQSSTRNKMSRIGVASDDLGGPEFFSGGISIPSRDQIVTHQRHQGIPGKAALNEFSLPRGQKGRSSSFRDFYNESNAHRSNCGCGIFKLILQNAAESLWDGQKGSRNGIENIQIDHGSRLCGERWHQWNFHGRSVQNPSSRMPEFVFSISMELLSGFQKCGVSREV
eukprot:Gb_05774 [translate_table: standard]